MVNNIENLKRVSVSLNVSDEKGRHLTPQPQAFSFIYGAASEGLSSLELVLSGKSVGDEVRMSVITKDLHKICGHLLHPLQGALQLPILPDRFELDMTLTDIEVAQDREIVEAIAKSISSCSGNCDCGCS